MSSFSAIQPALEPSMPKTLSVPPSIQLSPTECVVFISVHSPLPLQSRTTLTLRRIKPHQQTWSGEGLEEQVSNLILADSSFAAYGWPSQPASLFTLPLQCQAYSQAIFSMILFALSFCERFLMEVKRAYFFLSIGSMKMCLPAWGHNVHTIIMDSKWHVDQTRSSCSLVSLTDSM